MKSIYDSGWHHPFVAYVAGFVLMLAIARRLPFLYGYLFVFVTTILADACVTGAWSPVAQGTTAYTVFSVIFIILGDFRYFLLLERVAFPRRSWPRVLGMAAGISMVMPIGSAVLTRLVPAMRDDRVLYAVYESAMVVLVLVFARSRLASPELTSAVRRWLRGVAVTFAVLYAGWALCDVAILAGLEVAHVLRIVPNVLYYGAFLAVVFFTAPPEATDSTTTLRAPSASTRDTST